MAKEVEDASRPVSQILMATIVLNRLMTGFILAITLALVVYDFGTHVMDPIAVYPLTRLLRIA